MAGDKSRFVVSADWVEKHIGAEDFRIVDASWYLPAQKRNPKGEYLAGHVPGAVFYDQDEIADHTSDLPHTLPAAEDFAEAVGTLGISETDTIVVYDGPGIFSAPRVWWMFRLFGATKVYVLDGGLDGWIREGRPVETEIPQPEPARFKVNIRQRKVTSFEGMKSIVDGDEVQIADARGAGRFTGDEAEPRPGMRSGHMPGARSLPSGVFSVDGRFKSLTELKRTIEDAGIDLSKPVVTTCGSGVTAAIITLALESLGHGDNSLYDGSWAEWGARAETAVETGPAEAIESPSPEPITARVTRLEMTSAPKASLPVPVNIQTAIMRATEIPLPFYRFLLLQVGARWHWFERLRLSDEELKAIVHAPQTSISVLYVNGAPAGFYEYIRHDDDVVELCYFGLMEHALGLGIGKWFLLQALYSIWQTDPVKVTVTTNDLDHPRAVQLYQRFGFNPVETFETLVEPMGETELLLSTKRDTPGL